MRRKHFFARGVVTSFLDERAIVYGLPDSVAGMPCFEASERIDCTNRDAWHLERRPTLL